MSHLLVIIIVFVSERYLSLFHKNTLLGANSCMRPREDGYSITFSVESSSYPPYCAHNCYLLFPSSAQLPSSTILKLYKYRHTIVSIHHLSFSWSPTNHLDTTHRLSLVLTVLPAQSYFTFVIFFPVSIPSFYV